MKRACDIGEMDSGWIIVSLKYPDCRRVVALLRFHAIFNDILKMRLIGKA